MEEEGGSLQWPLLLGPSSGALAGLAIGGGMIAGGYLLSATAPPPPDVFTPSGQGMGGCFLALAGLVVAPVASVGLATILGVVEAAWRDMSMWPVAVGAIVGTVTGVLGFLLCAGTLPLLILTADSSTLDALMPAYLVVALVVVALAGPLAAGTSAVLSTLRVGEHTSSAQPASEVPVALATLPMPY